MSSEEIKLETDVGEDEKNACINLLRKEIDALDLFENLNLSNTYLLRFLYSTAFNVDAACLRIKGYHEHTRECPQFYPITGPLDRRSLIARKISTLLPECDREGRPVMIIKMGNINCRETTLPEMAEIDDNWFEYILMKNPEIAGKGLCYIFDLNDHGYGLVRWFKIAHLKMGIRKMATLPFKEFMFHCVNSSLLTKIIMKVSWPFIPESSKKNVRFHFDWLSLHEHIDPRCLPKEYGGCKEVDYESIYQNFFDGHEDIVKSYKAARNRTKST